MKISQPKYLLLLMLFALGQFQLTAQPKSKQQKQLDRLFQNRGELYFRFMLKDRKDLPELTRAISIDHKKGDTLFAFANKRGMQRFFELGYSRYKILETPAEEFRRLDKQEKRSKKKSGPLSTQAFDAYLTYPQFEQAMAAFQAAYPQLCRLVNLGTLPSGRKILALKISDSVDVTQNEPRFLYTSSIHGDETTGYPLMLKLADTLLRGYGSDTELTRLVNEMEIWINPLANPDGTYKAGNQTVSGATRFNAANIDLNRNYPDPQDGPHPDGEAWQPETKIFLKLADSLSFVMAANFHGGAEVWNFPWDTWQFPRHPDENWWTAEGVKFTSSARSNSPTYFNQNYGYPNLPGVCQGFDWYEVNGGRQDYMNWFHNCREVTIEVSDTKLIPNSQIPLHWTWLRRSLIDFMKSSLRGIRGRVTDACTGLPVRARIEVRNHDRENSHVFSTAEAGNFHRPIFPGSYQLLVSAQGYKTDSLPLLSVGEGDAQARNFALQPLLPQADFIFGGTNLCDASIRFSDRSGSASEWSWDFGDGSISTEKNPQHTYTQEGIFSVKLIAGNCAGSDTLLKMLSIFSPASPTVSGDTSNCGAVVHQLQAASANPVIWYSSPVSSVPLDSNQVFYTPVLDSTQVFFVRSNNLISVPNAGPGNNQFGGGSYFTGNTYQYLSFDAKAGFILKRVRVYANTAGTRNIQLRNPQGQVLQTKSVSIPQGESLVDLGFQIVPGEGYQLGLAGGASNNLFRNNSGAAYPYEIPGILSITGNSAGNPAFYYYFYDWEISASCNSEAVPVTALVLNAPRPRISISGPDTICEGNIASFQAIFSNTFNPQFEWFDGSLPLGSVLPSATVFLPPGAHSITCRLLSEDTCAVGNPAVSAPKIVQVLARPAPPQIALNGNQLASASGPVLWYLDGILLNITPSLTQALTGAGTYTAVLPSGSCPSLPSEPVVISQTTAMQQQFFRMWYDGDEVWMENKSSLARNVELISPEGKILNRFSAKPGISSVSLQKIPSGLLLLRLRDSGKILKLSRSSGN
jgi:PKD repeat protein